jgi:hypothetical protein
MRELAQQLVPAFDVGQMAWQVTSGNAETTQK